MNPLEQLVQAGERWLEARAAGHNTYKADRRYDAAMLGFRRAERRTRKDDKRRAQ